MNLAVMKFQYATHREECYQGIPKECIAEVIENCDTPPDNRYIIMTKEEYNNYMKNTHLPLWDEWHSSLNL